MSGGETMTFVGFAHRDNIATSRSRSARAFTTPEWDIDHESTQLVPTSTVRGCDGHDVDLITATYHPDGVDEHGFGHQPRSRIRGMGQHHPRRDDCGADS